MRIRVRWHNARCCTLCCLLSVLVAGWENASGSTQLGLWLVWSVTSQSRNKTVTCVGAGICAGAGVGSAADTPGIPVLIPTGVCYKGSTGGTLASACASVLDSDRRLMGLGLAEEAGDDGCRV